MKKLLLSLVLFAGIVASAWADPTAKAIYCADNTTLYFTYDEVTYGTSGDGVTTTFDGQTITAAYELTSFTLENGYGTGSLQDWKEYNAEIKTVKFMENFTACKPKKLNCFFYRMTALTTIVNGQYLDTSEVTSMSCTFQYCSSLTDLSSISNWNTGNVTNLTCIFSRCSSLENIDFFTNWNTEKVTSMGAAFEYTKIKNVDALAGKVDSQVQGISGIFYHCEELVSIEGVRDWNIENCTVLQNTFGWCKNVEDWSPIANWNVSKVYHVGSMFIGSSISDLTVLSGWSTSKFTNMQGTFNQCKKIKTLNGLQSWDTSKVEHLGNAFMGCSDLEDISALKEWDTSSLGMLGGTFGSCVKLKDISPLYNWNTSKVVAMWETFYNCDLEGRIDLSKWDLSGLSTHGNFGGDGCQGGMWHMFTSNEKIIGVTLGCGNFGCLKFSDTFLKQSYYKLFWNDDKLRYIDFSGCTDTYGNLVSVSRETDRDIFNKVPLTTVIYLPKDNTKPESGDETNVVYTANSQLECDKYYSEDKVDIELPHPFYAYTATYERTYSNTYGGVILPYPVKIADTDEDEFQPFLLQKEYTNYMFFKGTAEVAANTPFVFKRKTSSTDMTFAMSNVQVESTYDVNGETSDNIQEGFDWTAQGFYVTHEIEPASGKFSIPTKDDYPETATVDYDYDQVYYIASNKFYRCDNSTLYLDPHRIVFYGMWKKYTGGQSNAKPASFTIEEMDSDSPVMTAIKEAEQRLDEEKATAIYDASGNRLSETKRGINLLRMSDGSVKKVIKK